MGKRTVHIISSVRLNRALLKVTGELRSHGLWDARLRNVPIILVPAGIAYGWHWYGGNGEICIPRVSLLKLHDFFTGSYTSLADVLRHEFGHAVADTHRGLFRSRQFTTAFGGCHESNVRSKYDPEIHISRYSTTNPSEDFAENFMCFIRRRGILSLKHSTSAIRRKWRFIHALCRSIRCCSARW